MGRRWNLERFEGNVYENFVSTKAKHVIWWSQYCEHQGLACEVDEDCRLACEADEYCLMKNLLEPT